ncbi:MAG: alpha-glucan family phosphorylase [Planctomycetes bacterium]|nr:alpha-glucan family phosphorylase [Planctomycetota bacterium]
MKTYCHAPWVPEELEPILDVAYNFWWNTDPQARLLFHQLSPGLWRLSNHNPVALLRRMTRDELIAASARLEIRSELFQVHDRMRRTLEAGSRVKVERVRRGENDFHYDREPRAAYFSAEFGLHESLPNYSGGLGVLAGDHIRSASDLGVPIIGIGLLYRFGYFHQSFSLDNWQEERFSPNGAHNQPIQQVIADDGQPLTIELNLPGRKLKVQVWCARIGRSTLLLLDTYMHENWQEDRDITARLYDADREIRLKQEIVLGVGGVRALEALGINPYRFHMNEGHSAFLVLERCASLMKRKGLGFEQARLETRRNNVFTTHTPVSAGHEVFRRELMEPYFVPQVERLGLSPDEFFELGHRTGTDHDGNFEMTSLAIRFADHINGVSKLHGEVSRRQWQCMWPELPEDRVPIGHVTNGIHTGAWIGPEMRQVFDHYLASNWLDRIEDRAMWERVESIPADDLWEARRRQRARLIYNVRRRAQHQLIVRNLDRDTLQRKTSGLDRDALTIGFARRFATYKRATLLFRHADRLRRLVGSDDRPVQILFAGKAHPADDAGKRLLQEVQELALDPGFRGRIILLEDYDIGLARKLVQGCDVWLNNPRPPKEASGTSGMKVCPNGGLTCSTRDGWWVEGESPLNGWTIGRGWTDRDDETVDAEDADSLMNLLENEIVPLFYDRDAAGLPQGWITRMRASIKTVTPYFSTQRMVREYAEKYYS